MKKFITGFILFTVCICSINAQPAGMGKSDPEAKKVLDAVSAAWAEGCPVAGQAEETRISIVTIAIRRFRSFDRRGVQPHDRDAQIRDLARGLVAQLEKQPDLVGPLMTDYEYLSSKILDAIQESGLHK